MKEEQPNSNHLDSISPNMTDFSHPEKAVLLLKSLQENPPSRRIRIMNVCGSHERTVASLGLRKVLPETIRLIPGPGCPVCVCPENDIRDSIHIATTPGVILAVYGDLVRVPLSREYRGMRSLAECREAGCDVRIVSSPMEVLKLAEENPKRETVFFSAGFETTTAPLAALAAEGVPSNLTLLVSHKRTSPAVKLLLESGEPSFDALICPGHVSAVAGSEDWRFVTSEFGIPAVVCGFYDLSLLAGIRRLCDMVELNESGFENYYGQVVKPHGNERALELIDRVFDIGAVFWRGVGPIPESGYLLSQKYSDIDARKRFSLNRTDNEESLPEGCSCHHVVMGRLTPEKCPLFGRACKPSSPVGPCMVSSEGACRIWYDYPGSY